jgi:hypothetical protein
MASHNGASQASYVRGDVTAIRILSDLDDNISHSMYMISEAQRLCL